MFLVWMHTWHLYQFPILCPWQTSINDLRTFFSDDFQVGVASSTFPNKPLSITEDWYANHAHLGRLFSFSEHPRCLHTYMLLRLIISPRNSFGCCLCLMDPFILLHDLTQFLESLWAALVLNTMAMFLEMIYNSVWSLFSKDQGQFISLYSDLIVYMSANYNYSSAIV